MNGAAAYKKFFAQFGIGDFCIIHHCIDDLQIEFVKI